MVWILSQKTSAAGVGISLYCLPHAGGGASVYLSWAQALNPAIDVLPIQPPGRENRLRESAFSNLDSLVRAAYSAMRHDLHKPYALFGHSMGALVAFELAREIRRHALPPPVHLFVCAKRAPQLPERMSPLSGLSDGELLQTLEQRYGLATGAEWRELLVLMLPTIRADIAAIEGYAYREEPPFDFPITAIGGVDDIAVPATDLEAWAMHTTAKFTVHQLTAGHFFPVAVHKQLCALIRTELLR